MHTPKNKKWDFRYRDNRDNHDDLTQKDWYIEFAAGWLIHAAFEENLSLYDHMADSLMRFSDWWHKAQLS